MSMTTPSTISSWGRFVAEGLRHAGQEPAEILQRAAIPLDVFVEPNGRVSVEQMTRFWEAISASSQLENFPLSLAEKAHPEMFSGLGLAIVLSETVYEVVLRLCKFSEVLSSAVELDLHSVESDRFELRYTALVPVHDMAVQSFMTCGYKIVKDVADAEFRPARVSMRGGGGLDREKVEAFFQCEVELNADAFKVVFTKASLELPCLYPNPGLIPGLETWMDRHISESRRTSLQAALTRIVVQRMSSGDVGLQSMAAALHKSERTIQRTLKHEGTTFRELVDQTRLGLAKEYLARSELSMTNICYLLAFSDQSNFTKAFKRWTGQTPSEYRTAIKRDATP